MHAERNGREYNRRGEGTCKEHDVSNDCHVRWVAVAMLDLRVVFE